MFVVVIGTNGFIYLIVKLIAHAANIEILIGLAVVYRQILSHHDIGHLGLIQFVSHRDIAFL